jgi:hypothetical protein
MGFIDTDSHVLETSDTWSFLEPSEEHFRPQILEFEPGSVIRLGARAKNTAMPRTPSKIWTAGDTWTRYMPPTARSRHMSTSSSQACST